MQSVPALVERAYWNGAHSFSKSLAMRRRREHPVAMPRGPPSFFVNAVSLAEVSAFEMLAMGARLRKTGHCVEKQLKKRSVSSNSTFKCS